MRPALLFAVAACLVTFASASAAFESDHNETVVNSTNEYVEPVEPEAESVPDFTIIRYDEVSQHMSVREYVYNNSLVNVWSLDCNMTSTECNQTNYTFDPFGLFQNETDYQDLNTTDECGLDEYPEGYTRNESENGGHAYLNVTEA